MDVEPTASRSRKLKFEMHLWLGQRISKSNLKRFCACNVLRCDWLEGRFPSLCMCACATEASAISILYAGDCMRNHTFTKRLHSASAHARRSDAFHRQIESHRFQLCTSHTTNILIYARTIDLNNDDIMQYAVVSSAWFGPIVRRTECVGIWCDL